MKEEIKNKLIEILIEKRFASDQEEAEEILKDRYSGEFESREHYCKEFAYDAYDLAKNPCAPYIDWEYYARDLFGEDGTRLEIRLKGVSHVFHSM